MPTVAVTTRPPDPHRRAIERGLAGEADIRWIGDLERADRLAAAGDADVLIGWNPQRELGGSDWSRLDKLRFVQLLSAGAEQLDYGALPDHVAVASNVGAYAAPMAEHVLAMVLALAKRLLPNHGDMIRGGFDQQTPTTRLAGRTATILGFGGIGRAVARLLGALGMHIQAINRSGATDEPVSWVGTLDQLHRALATADAVIVTLPLTAATEGLIGKRELGWMKPNAILVNVGRAAVIDEASLYEHLTTHRQFQAGIDVWWDEPRRGHTFSPAFPFLDLDNVLGSPHNSAISEGSIEDAFERGAANVARHLRREPVAGTVDPADYRSTR